MRKRWWAGPCTAVPPHSWIAAAEAHSSVWGGGETWKHQTRKNNGGKHKWEGSLCLLWGSAVVSLYVNILEVIQFWFLTDLFCDLAKGSCSDFQSRRVNCSKHLQWWLTPRRQCCLLLLLLMFFQVEWMTQHTCLILLLQNHHKTISKWSF